MPKGVYQRGPQSAEHILNRVTALKRGGKTFRENHYQWKGDDAGYSAVHRWIQNHYGKAEKCCMADDTCSNRYEWSNISGQYKRDMNDWQQLCASHHRRFDGATPRLGVQDVRDIRVAYEDRRESQGRLAKRYGVSKMTIWNIIHRRKWEYVI